MEQEKKMTTEELTKQAEAVFWEKVSGGKTEEIIDAIIKFGNYSVKNAMLIASQNPNATEVNSMKGWNKLERSIKPGEKSIRTVAPDYDDNHQFVGFKVNFVFDAAQTEGAEYESQSCLAEKAAKYPESVLAALNSIAGPFSDEVLPPEDISAALTLAIEKGLRTRNWEKQKFLGDKSLEGMAQFDRDLAAYILSSQLGLEAQPVVLPDVSVLDEKQRTRLIGNFESVRQVCRNITGAVSTAIQSAMAEDQTQEFFEETGEGLPWESREELNARAEKAAVKKNKARLSEPVMG